MSQSNEIAWNDLISSRQYFPPPRGPCQPAGFYPFFPHSPRQCPVESPVGNSPASGKDRLSYFHLRDGTRPIPIRTVGTCQRILRHPSPLFGPRKAGLSNSPKATKGPQWSRKPPRQSGWDCDLEPVEKDPSFLREHARCRPPATFYLAGSQSSLHPARPLPIHRLHRHRPPDPVMHRRLLRRRIRLE